MKYTQLDMKDGDILIEKDGTRWIPVWIYDDIKSRWLFEYVRITQGSKLHRFNPRGFYSRFDRFLRSKVINYDDNIRRLTIGLDSHSDPIDLPFFLKDEKYKGMEDMRRYTLEELGIYYREDIEVKLDGRNSLTVDCSTTGKI